MSECDLVPPSELADYGVANAVSVPGLFPMPQSKTKTLRSAHLFLHGNDLSVIPAQSGTVESSAGGVYKMHSNVQSSMRKRFGRKRLLELIFVVPACYAGCFTVALVRRIVLSDLRTVPVGTEKREGLNGLWARRTFAAKHSKRS